MSDTDMKKALFLSSLLCLMAGSEAEFLYSSVQAHTLSALERRSPNSNRVAQAVQPVQPQVQLLKPGSEPRQLLRWRPAANTQQTLKITMDMDATTSIAGESLPAIPTPTSIVEADVRITRVDPNGDIHAQFTYNNMDTKVDPNVRPEVAEIMRQQLQALVGMNGTFVMDSRGNIKTSDLNIPQGLAPVSQQVLEQLSNSFTQMSTPFPEEEVGRGAQWQVSTTLDFSGMKLAQTAIYELVDLQDNVATLNVSLEQSAAPQNLSLPELPAGATAFLKSLQSTGTGQLTLQLDRIMPALATISSRTNNEIAIKEAENAPEIIISSQISMQMRLESN